MLYSLNGTQSVHNLHRSAQLNQWLCELGISSHWFVSKYLKHIKTWLPEWVYFLHHNDTSKSEYACIFISPCKESSDTHAVRPGRKACITPVRNLPVGGVHQGAVSATCMFMSDVWSVWWPLYRANLVLLVCKRHLERKILFMVSCYHIE